MMTNNFSSLCPNLGLELFCEVLLFFLNRTNTVQLPQHQTNFSVQCNEALSAKRLSVIRWMDGD